MSSKSLRTSLPRKPFRELSSSQKRRVLNVVRTKLRSRKKAARPANVSVPDIPLTSSSSFAYFNVESSRQPTIDIDIDHDMPGTSSSFPSSIPSRNDTARPSAVAVSEPSFRDSLATCFVDNNISHTQANNILRVLHKHSCFRKLPIDARTLLSTPRTRVTTSVVEPGEYVHFGVESKIIEYLCETLETIPERLILDFHVDGCTIDTHKKVQLWPIQIRIINMRNSKPMVVGIYKGPNKPGDCNIYLKKFVSDINVMMSKGGIIFQGKTIPVQLRCFIADALARAFILNHKNHLSSNPCSKCKLCGTTIGKRRVFRGINHHRRCDNDYANSPDKYHQKGNSPLAALQMGMVSQVPFEYMHLVCLGIVKKLLSAWVSGNYSKETRLSRNMISIISARMAVLDKYCPSDFSRRPRPIEEYSTFKATEFRQFLLYTGPVVMYGILATNVYTHFLLLHIAIRILVSPSLIEKHVNFAKAALELFVSTSEEFYGSSFLSYNVHCLLHLADDASRFGTLDSFSAFAYENTMSIFNRYIRTPGKPLQQYVNRMAELKSHGSTEGCSDYSTTTVHASMIKFFNLGFSKNDRDNCCILRDGSICIIASIHPCEDAYTLGVRRFEIIDQFYDVLLSSSDLDIFKCAALSTDVTFVSIQDVTAKSYRMPLNSTHANGDDALGISSQWVVKVLAHAEKT
ncbi:uncharacterized protein LOC143220006 [Lasioglossum baleicum]|uniref:uncharacterized protein LOC143220006 n=1 Tax=Lasioglossum baleicum TaxID=434251 RepID=UPI003FCCCC89